jgi:hypothetical protein
VIAWLERAALIDRPGGLEGLSLARMLGAVLAMEVLDAVTGAQLAGLRARVAWRRFEAAWWRRMLRDRRGR